MMKFLMNFVKNFLKRLEIFMKNSLSDYYSRHEHTEYFNSFGREKEVEVDPPLLAYPEIGESLYYEISVELSNGYIVIKYGEFSFNFHSD